MKYLVVVAVLAIACASALPRQRRSFYEGGLYASGVSSVGGVYAASAPVISSYTTARQLPSYYVPESTHVTTASNTIYSVPVTYSTTYAQPVVRTTSYYNTVPASYVGSFAHGSAWGAGIARVGYSDSWW